MRELRIRIGRFAGNVDFAGLLISVSGSNQLFIGDMNLPICYDLHLDVIVVDPSDQKLAFVEWRSVFDENSVVVMKYSGDRTLRQRLHFSHNTLTDMLDGRPACEEYDIRGRLKSHSFYSNGVLQDGSGGEPGWTDYYPDTGRKRLVQRFLAGDLNDGPNGEPAYLELAPDGSVVQEAHFRRGRTILRPDQGGGSSSARPPASRSKATRHTLRSDRSSSRGPR